MDEKRLEELQFWIVIAIADRERNRDEIRRRMASLRRVAGVSTHSPREVADALTSLCRTGLAEKLDGSSLLARTVYRLTAAGRQACRDEIDARRRELDAINKDTRGWLPKS